jgi:hypothetical protein
MWPGPSLSDLREVPSTSTASQANSGDSEADKSVTIASQEACRTNVLLLPLQCQLFLTGEYLPVLTGHVKQQQQPNAG